MIPLFLRCRLFARQNPTLTICVAFVTVLGLFLSLASPSHRLPRFLPYEYPIAIYPHASSTPHPQADIRISALLQDAHSRLAELYRDNGQGAAPEAVFTFPTLTRQQEERYHHLRKQGQKYMLTAITRQVADQLPDLINSLLVLTHYLGPSSLSFSILEGPSDDLTPLILSQILKPMLLEIHIPAAQIRISTNAPKIDFSKGNRIEILAGLRNEAMAPLWDGSAIGRDVDAVVSFNDVYLKAEHVLEVLHQHSRNNAGITTAWDWYEREPAYFYDIWVARTIDTGDLFYPINWPWWSPSTSILSTSPPSLKAFQFLQPFQAFSSWNALVVLAPEPFLEPDGVRFRRSELERGECAASECSLLAVDYWKAGWGRVMVVPSVQLAYTRKVATETESLMIDQRVAQGWIEGIPPKEFDAKIHWITTPPEKVRCHPWPEKNGLSANVWEKTEWVPPFVRDTDWT